MADINETKQCKGKIMHVWKCDMETVALTSAATFRVPVPQRKLCTENNCLREWMEQRRSRG